MGHGYLRETLVNDVEPLKKDKKIKEAGARYFRRIGMPNLFLGENRRVWLERVAREDVLS